MKSNESPFGHNANGEPMMYGPEGWVTYYGDTAHHVTPAQVAGPGEVVVNAWDLRNLTGMSDESAARYLCVEEKNLRRAALAAQSEPSADEHPSPETWCERHGEYGCCPEPADQGEGAEDRVQMAFNWAEWRKEYGAGVEQYQAFVAGWKAASSEPWHDTPAPPADRTPDAATSIEAACEVMHDAYERAAIGAGWETQKASRKPWADVPEANKATMRAAVAALLDHLSTEPASGQPDGETEPLTQEETDYTDFLTQMVAQSEAHATAKAKRYADVAEDRAVERARGEVVAATREVARHLDNQYHSTGPEAALRMLADVLAQSGQHTEKEND